MDVIKVKQEIKSEDEDEDFAEEQFLPIGSAFIKTEAESPFPIKSEEPSPFLRSLLTGQSHSVPAVESQVIKREEKCLPSSSMTEDSHPFSSKLRSLLTSTDHQEKAFKCTSCVQSFSLPSELRNHYKETHQAQPSHNDAAVVSPVIKRVVAISSVREDSHSSSTSSLRDLLSAGKTEEHHGLKEAFVAVLHVSRGCCVEFLPLEDVQVVNKIKEESQEDFQAPEATSGQNVMVIAPVRVNVRFGPYKGKISEDHAAVLVSSTTFSVGLIDFHGLKLMQGQSVEENFQQSPKDLLLKVEEQDVSQSLLWPSNRDAAYEFAKKTLLSRFQHPTAPAENTFVAMFGKSEISTDKAEVKDSVHSDIPAGSKLLAFKFQCGFCNKGIYQAGYKAKYRFSNGERIYLVCKECKSSFPSTGTASFTAHLKSHIQTCQVCLDVFCCPQHLTKHLMLYHSEESGNRLTCKVCNKTLASRSFLRRHLKCHVKEDKSFSCTVCPKSYTTLSRLKEHLKIHSARPFMCDECHRCFLTSEELGYHAKVHKESKSYPCDICSKYFASVSLLKRHKQSHEKFPCEVCGKELSSLNYLNQHMMAHTGERPFSCHMCPKKFTTRYLLKSHRNHMHNMGNQFICAVCSKRFTLKSSLTAHSIRYHGKKPFSCPKCRKAFDNRIYLRKHMKVHRPHRCGVCHKAYRNKTSLDYHYRQNKTHIPC